MIISISLYIYIGEGLEFEIDQSNSLISSLSEEYSIDFDKSSTINLIADNNKVDVYVLLKNVVVNNITAKYTICLAKTFLANKFDSQIFKFLKTFESLVRHRPQETPRGVTNDPPESVKKLCFSMVLDVLAGFGRPRVGPKGRQKDLRIPETGYFWPPGSPGPPSPLRRRSETSRRDPHESPPASARRANGRGGPRPRSRGTARGITSKQNLQLRQPFLSAP